MAGIDTSTGGATYPPTPYTSGIVGSPFFDWLLRNQIIPMVIDGRNNAVPALGRLYKRVRHVAGKFILQPVRDGRNYAGISAMHPEANMPDPGRQGAYMYSLPTRMIYARAKFSAKLLRANDGPEALADLMEYEVGGLKDDLAIKQEIMLFSDGSGRRGEVGAIPGANANLVVQLNQDHEGISTVVTARNIYLDVGMRISFVTAAGTVKPGTSGRQAFYIVAKPSATTIQISATLGGAAISNLSTEFTANQLAQGDWIVDATRDASMDATSGVPVDTAWRGEPMGIEGIFRDVGVLDGNGISTAGQQTGAQNFTVTSVTDQACGFQGVQCNGAALTNFPPVPDWNKAIIADGGGALRNISDDLIQRALSDSRRINNAKVTELWSAHQMYDAYVATLYGDKRFNSTVISGGHSGDGVETGGVTFNGMPWHKFRFMLENRIIGMDPDMISIWENEPLKVATPPGNPIYERLHDKDQFWIAFVTEYNLFDELRQRTGFSLVDVQ